MKRHTLSYVIDKINQLGGWTLVSGDYKNAGSLLKVKCVNGHILSRSLKKLMQDNGYCYKCAKNIKDYEKVKIAKQIADNRGGLFLSNVYLGSKKKYLWQCSKSHRWFATYESVVSVGAWCPKCRFNFPCDINVAHSIAADRGGICLSNNYVNAKSHLVWQCSVGHTWHASLDNVKNNNTWCPVCNGGNYIDLKFVKDYVAEKNGVCLSDKYNGGKCSMEFMCENKHIWKTSFRSIFNNHTWCPVCAKLNNKSQSKLFDILSNIFKNKTIEYNFKGFDWLKTSKYGKQEIDLWVPHLKLAIEYDGEQHFKPMRFGSKEEMVKKLRLIQKRDKIKDQKIKQNPEDVKYFVRINYLEKLTKNNIMKILSEHNVPI